MLIRHSAIYFLGRVIPGIVSILTLALFTRLMSPEQYGQYSLVITGVGIVNAVCFQWVSLGVGRFLPSHEADPTKLLSTALAAFFMLVGVTAVLGSVAALLCSERLVREFIILAVSVGWAQAWFDLNLKIINTRLAPVRYGLISSIKATLALGAGAGFFYLGLGVPGVLLGLAIGLLAATGFIWKQWNGLSIRSLNKDMLKDFVRYGVPLTMTLILTLILDVSDRFLLNMFLDARAVGAYASAYDLTQQSLGMLLGVVHLAAFPLALRALEEKGTAAAQIQLKKNFLMLLAISVPATVGLIMLAGNIAFVMLGAEFRADASHIILVIAISIFVAGVKSYYFDYSFQLGKKLKGQVWTVLCAALVNVGLNLWWIPLYGVLGAAYATLAGFLVGTGVSWYLGRNVFRMPPMDKDVYKVIVAASIMALSLLPILERRGLVALLCQVLLGSLSYAVFLFILNVGQLRLGLKRYLQ